MKYLVMTAGVLLVVVVAGWYCSENFSGRISRNAEIIGYSIIQPGQLVDSVLSGNFHGGFGDWRDPVIEIGAAYVIWFLPCLILASLFQRFRVRSKLRADRPAVPR